MLGSILRGGNKIPQDWLLSQKKINKKAKLYGWGGEKGSGKVGPGREEAKQLRGTKRSLTEENPGSED